METKINTDINLDNGYYLKEINNIRDLSADVIDIKKLKLISTLKQRKLLLKIDFNSFNKKQYKKLLKKLLFVKKVVTKTKISIGKKEESKILLGYIINYDEDNKNQNDFISAINAIFYSTKYERYNYIYDTICDYLDYYFYGKNVCDFKDNKCGEKRNTSSITGCCHHFKCKALGPYLPNNKFVTCEYLQKDGHCGTKCLGCKLFTCDYLEKKGIKFKIKDILLLNVFFNPLQKYFMKFTLFTTKEKVMKRLMRTGL